MEDDILSSKEIAEWLGVKHRTVYQWRYRGIFPEPDVKARPPLWYRSTIAAWVESRLFEIPDAADKADAD